MLACLYLSPPISAIVINTRHSSVDRRLRTAERSKFITLKPRSQQEVSSIQAILNSAAQIAPDDKIAKVLPRTTRLSNIMFDAWPSAPSGARNLLRLATARGSVAWL